MNAVAWYILKVIVCSGVLTGYYFIALRNESFHKWNRFYILTSLTLSLLLPMVKIDIFQKAQMDGPVISIIKNINNQNNYLIRLSTTARFDFNAEMLITFIYCLISLVLLTIIVASVIKIQMWRKVYPSTRINDIEFLDTNLKSAPFSFMYSIFWNNKIKLHSKSGMQILHHEITHIKQGHTFDKLFINIILVFYWANPFYWILKKELNMIHEFIADESAVEHSDVSTYTAAVLETLYPGRDFSITNRFFYSPLKRRLTMLTKLSNKKSNYMARIIAIPMMLIVFSAFTLNVKSTRKLSDNFISAQTDTIIKPPPPPAPAVHRRPKKSNKKFVFVPPTIVKNSDTVPPPPPPVPLNQLPSNLLYIVDGKQSTKMAATEIENSRIVSVNALNEKEGITRFGEKGKNGVIIITTRNHAENLVFVRTEVEPQFPGGDRAWFNYISNVIKNNSALLSKSDEGTCMVKFIVEIDGSVSNVNAESMNGTKLAQLAVNGIKDGPRWIPAQQNNHIVRAYKSQAVSFKITN